MRKALHDLDEWLTEIEEQAFKANTIERKSRLIEMQRETMHRLYLRITDLESVECYRKHMDTYMRLNGAIE